MPDSPHSHRLRTYRKSIRGQLYSLTISCADRREYLARDDVRDLVAEMIEEAVHHCFARLDAYVVMPDHVHVLFQLGDRRDLAAAVRELKAHTARRVNRLLGRRGALWQDGYYEHAIRGEDDYLRYWNYMLENPIRKGLASSVGEYRWARVGPWQA